MHCLLRRSKVPSHMDAAYLVCSKRITGVQVSKGCRHHARCSDESSTLCYSSAIPGRVKWGYSAVLDFPTRSAKPRERAHGVVYRACACMRGGAGALAPSVRL
eukprot:6187602-Pleurochrysis_carterae.AAC.2